MKKIRTDVIENYEYASENPKYNAAFLDWRRQTKAAHIYRYTDYQNESVFVTGNASAPPNAELAERGALMRCGELIGAALLLFLISELVGGSLLIALLRLFHIDIRLDFLLLTMDGSQWARCAVRMIVVILKYLLPSLLIMQSCKIPKQLAMPLRFGALPESLIAIGAGMIISGIYSVLSNAEGVMRAEELFSYKDMTAIFTYGIFQAVIASFLAELFLRGCLFTLLRQFGDPFAILCIAAAAFLAPNTMPDRVSELLLGFACGYLLARSGSILKCVLVRFIFTVLSYARLVVIYTSHKLQLWEYALLLISLGVLICALYARYRKEKIRLMNRKTLLPISQKLSAVTLSVTMLPWVATSALLTLVQLFN